MEFRDAVSLPMALGVGLTNAAFNVARDVRHASDLADAQRWIDHLSASAQAANEDFRAVAAELAAVKRAYSNLQFQLETSEHENLQLTMQVRHLKSGAHRGNKTAH